MNVRGPDGTCRRFPRHCREAQYPRSHQQFQPVLVDDSVERAGVVKEGWDVVYDGMG